MTTGGHRKLERTSGALVVLTAIGVVEIRILLEHYVYRIPPLSFPVFGLHFPLFYLGLALSVACIISVAADVPVERASKVTLLGLIIILAVPVIDIAVYGRHGRSIVYLPADVAPLRQFIHAVFLRDYRSYISIGQFVVVHCAAIAAGTYVWQFTRRLVSAGFTWLLVLVLIYLYSVVPMSILRVLADINDLLRASCGFRMLGLTTGMENKGIILTLDGVCAAIHLVLFPIVLACVGLLSADRQRFATLLTNSRPLRMGHYVLLTLFGIVVGIKELGRLEMFLFAPTNLLALVLLLLGVASAFYGAVWVNDIGDVSLDAAGGRQGPLVSGLIDARHASLVALLASGFALVCGALLGPVVALVLLVTMVLSSFYSLPPLRLRRYFPVSALVIGMITVLVFYSGYVLVAGNRFVPPPPRLALGIALGTALLSTFKDVKDGARDKAGSVNTLMTVLPGAAGHVATGVCVFLGCNVIAWALCPGIVGVAVGIGAGSLGFGFAVRHGRNQRLLLVVYFVFIIPLMIRYATRFR